MGLPVIGTQVGGVPETMMPGRSGLLVPPNDPGALAQALDLLLGDAALRRRMGEAGRARARPGPVHAGARGAGRGKRLPPLAERAARDGGVASR